MKLLIDMNLLLRWGAGSTCWLTQALMQLTGLVLGAYNASDNEIMAYAKANDYIVLTHDLDFSTILAATHDEKSSLVQIRADDVNPDVIGRQVITALQQMSTELADGALLTVDTSRTRVRLLPLRTKLF